MSKVWWLSMVVSFRPDPASGLISRWLSVFGILAPSRPSRPNYLLDVMELAHLHIQG
jgi:hypothetical protein